MVKFNKLSVFKGGEKLSINVSIEDLPYYSNVYIDSIYIDNQDTYIEKGPSDNSALVYIAEENEKSTNIIIDWNNPMLSDISIKEDLLFVYVKIKGTPAPDTPCEKDRKFFIGVTYNACTLYDSMMQSIRDVLNDCSIPKVFIDKFLRFEALEYSIITNHYIEAIKFFNRFFKGKKVLGSTIKDCNCHG